MNEPLNDTQPAYDIYVEEDRVTLVRRQEPVVESTPTREPLRWVLIVMLGAHGLIALLCLMLTAYLTLVPATATVYALASRIPAIAHVYALPAVSMNLKQIVNTTGRVHVPATQARGLVTFYNSLTSPQVIASGTLLIGADGEQVVTDQVAYVPAGNYASNGQATVWAHALNYGTEGNIRTGDVSGPCCRPLIQAVNGVFSGGHDARDYQTVTQADISTATTGLLAQLQHSLAGRMASLLSPGEVMLTPVPCTTHTASNHPVGTEVQQVAVTVAQNCTSAAYRLDELQRALASLIAGKTPGQARAILQGQGIRGVGIQLGWLRDRLPANPDQIRIVLIFH